MRSFPRLLAALLFFACYSVAFTQPQAFQIHTTTLSIPGFQGVHSAVVAEMDGQLIVMGGRTEGLDKRQPFASFLTDGNNPLIQVVDPQTSGYWSADVGSLPNPIREQLLATNLQFFQDGQWLYIIGGYGFSTAADDHVTHPLLTAIRLDSLVAAVQNGQALDPWFKTIQDERFAVSGGQLGLLDGTYYLVGGHRFDGRYNPMNHPTFTQSYTEAVRRFIIVNDGNNLSVDFLPEWNDPINLHRRDYNLLPQIFPDGESGFTAFSGVFQQFADLPYLNTVDIRPGGYSVNNDFQHRLNQYHCGHLALYDSLYNRMHTVFLGGISQYYYNDAGQLIQDDNVPFVRTIGLVSRQANGTMTEEKIGDLDAYLGASAEFVWMHDLPFFREGIAGMNQLGTDSVLLGYLIGGINSQEPNIFFNNLDLSTASNQIRAVYWSPDFSASNVKVPASLPAQASVQPNPTHDVANINYTLTQSVHVDISLQAPDGRLITTQDLGVLEAGEQQFQFRMLNFPAGLYLATLRIGQEMTTLKIVVK
ncbi:MAG: T9SS type A sorting domain-containing protein [Lewinellaceae bacterium]|nr:T9SS type A sorting domain-containing protein [Lewinellaceae bacterium]